MRALSLGGGVQSTALALMTLDDPPDVALFADTGWETQATLDHVARLGELLPYPVVTVRPRVPLRAELLGGGFAPIPAFLADGGQGARQCTKRAKVAPIRRALRDLGARRAELWLGISADEVGRVKGSGVAWLTHRWPLLERGLTRADCARWLEAHGYGVPARSACVGCPYRGADDWRAIRADPVAWADAVEVDAALGARGFLHTSRRPLPLAPIDAPSLGLWGDECAGLCAT